MQKTILASAFLAGLGLAASTLPSAALPVSATGVAPTAGIDVVQVRMHRRYRMRQGSASRGNAAMPSRAPAGSNTVGRAAARAADRLRDHPAGAPCPAGDDAPPAGTPASGGFFMGQCLA